MRTKLVDTLSLIAFFLIASSVLFIGCGKKPATAEEGKEAPQPIEVLSLQYGNLLSSLKVPGELISYRDVDLYAKVNGFAKQLFVDVGTEVKEGQLLALMEAPEIISQLAAAESKLQSQQALYNASKLNYDRLLETSKTPGTISKNDLDQALGKATSDFAQLEAAKAFYKEISVMKNYLEIRAPFGGIISARNVSLGAFVGPSGKGSEFPLFTLNEQAHLRLVTFVPEAYTSLLHKNDTVQFTVKAFPSDKFAATIKRQAGALEKKLRAERIEMDVTNLNKKLLPGMLAEVKLGFASSENTFVVPVSAVVNSTERIFVVRIVDQKVNWVDVRLGREANGQVEIYGKLTKGDILVVRASEEIRNEAEIKVIKNNQIK
jgi:RND family efflux transporter MFP subunit